MSVIVEKLSKRLGQRWVFRDVSFEARAGEIFGIFGPNDAGKNTLLQAIVGETQSNGGSVSVTNGALYLDANGPGSIPFFKSVFGKKSIPPASDRQRQIEKAIRNADDIVLLNEPFSGFDSPTKRTLIDKLAKEVRERNLTLILTTSDFDSVLQACDNAAVLADGYLQQSGTPQELYDAPETHIVAALTGRHNLFEARRLTSSKSEMPEFQTIDGEHRLFTQKTELRSLGSINKNVTLAIRPEQISISFGASFPEDNLIKALISGIHFLGPTTIIDLDCSGLMLQALVFRVVGLNVGDECMVGLPPDRIRILKD
jgi:ABC-type Fe3+/spermidine/putrescine transport system ATPase subunit